MLAPAVFMKLPAKPLYISSFVVAAEVIYKRTSKFASQIPQARCAFINATKKGLSCKHEVPLVIAFSQSA